MNIKDIKTAYFLGIGGIGMSAIARYFKAIGIEVLGYDKTRNDFTLKLEEEGFDIHYFESLDSIPENVKNGYRSIVIYTPAIPKDNIEFRYFVEHDIHLYKRAEVLGMISSNAYTIAVAGTHGKTTTSSMLAHLFNECGINFTAFLGGISANFESNYVHKTDGISLFEKPIMVLEADEFDRSFLHLNPDIAIVTSTDADHLDIYGEPEEVKRSFQEFVDKLKKGGWAIINDLLDLKTTENLITYGKTDAAMAQYSGIKVINHQFCFVYKHKEYSFEVRNSLPGFHNVENATAAITVCLHLNLPSKFIIAACGSFKGVRRRFEYVYNRAQYVVIDDYAHHPTELKACINSVRELYPKKHITGVFQPHLYSRTRDFADEFAEALDLLDECWLMDIYPARELPIEGINAEYIALKMAKTPLLISKENVVKKLEEKPEELLIILGAGNIDQLVKPIRTIYEKADRIS
ncbi:MAG: UDP-N-acetylmuramate--L-alanine ligase [Bacteroidia bacterium]|nr:UDP-N-acetylmuramate--L-alanine ligase [Bacteroidia bacterium]